MRRRTALDPAVAAELEALDAALAGDPADAELTLVVAEARASAPRMSPAFAARLEAAVDEGFATSSSSPSPARPARPAWLRRPPLMPALGGLAAVLLALAVTVSAIDGGSRGDDGAIPISSSPGSAESTAGAGVVADRDASAKDATASVAAPQGVVAPAAGQTAADLAQRRVQRAADLTISTPIAELQDTSDAVVRTADRLGGYVQRSDVSAGGRRGQATFDLRIPADRLDEALATLSRLGHVRARTQQSEDITARFTSARSRLHDARAERQALLRALATATTSQEIESLQARLDIQRSRIAAAKGDLFAARRAADLARVGVTVLGVSGGDESGGGAGGGEPWTPARALDDAVDVLSVAAGVLIVGLAGAIPAALLALLAALAWRVHRRRSRELALAPHSPAV